MKNNFCFGIVTFNPNLEDLKDNISLIYNQTDKIIIVDNGSYNIDKLKKCLKKFYSKIIIMENKKNEGIAFALNQLVYISSKLDFDWIIMLDQDTKCPAKMVDIFAEFCNRENVAIICPDYREKNGKYIEKKDKVELVNECITSGSAINIQICNRVNGFNNKLFIDFVDYDFCYKIKRLGYDILKINNCVIEHEIGKLCYYKILFWEIPDYNHNAFRKYYITRNSIYISKYYPEFSNIIINYLKIIKRLILVILFESDKLEKVRQMFKGIHDSKHWRELVE